jgi:tetratricopeptide (TPR) repeat protein
VKLGICLVAVALSAGCASRGPFVVDPPGSEAREAALAAQDQHRQSLSEYIARVRAIAAEARPVREQPVSVESADPHLAAALALAGLQPSPSALRAVASEYRRLGVVDRAHDYLQRALRFDRRDAATYDALARLWRDSGFPVPALGDAHRAVFFAPDSPVAHNTLGTVLQLLGRHDEARQQYEAAVRLDPKAVYALNNLCYAWLLDGSLRRAASTCEAAIALDPSLAAARNNLGLVHALRGDLASAQAAFDAAGDPATTLYNVGIVHLANRRFDDAVSAFAAAQQARPAWRMAAVRERQARDLATGEEE